MQLEDYFEFDQTPERIRVKGSRIGIDVLVDEFNAGMSPETIMRRYYPSLTLEQVYATVTYYLHNKAEVDAYVKRVVERAEAGYQKYLQQGVPPVVEHLRALKAEQQKSKTGS
jgi:uncharacterized protein (DUF433 family)